LKVRRSIEARTPAQDAEMDPVNLSPREIVSELDRYIIGQHDAKRAVAIALRNRWRRQQLPEGLREEVVPKNILMIGPTGVGKTEIARRLARLANAPFLKVEATKFTEVGYVGRDVESIIRDLIEVSISQLRESSRRDVQAKAEAAAEERLVTALVGEGASGETKLKFRRMLRDGQLEDKEVEVEVADAPGAQPIGMMDIPGMPPNQMGNMQEMLGKMFGGRPKRRKMHVPEARAALTREEADRLLDQEKLTADAVRNAEQNGIVFIDEIDKVCARTSEGGFRGGDVSREGVQRDLLPLIEGTSVATKYGPVKTDHILFIASGAFHIAKPSDLLPELQGRLPIRVELAALTRDDFRRILTEPEHSLIKQYVALLGTERITLDFADSAVDALADMAADINARVENIGARRLATVLERLLEEVSFSASDKPGEAVTIDAAYVAEKVGALAGSTDLSRFIL
jgi:ATP-dependent HslUV protease ATP-binding subunit HslU